MPRIGAATPKASSGPVDVQVSVETVVWSSCATWGSATTKTVKVMLTESSPASTVQRTHHRYRSDSGHPVVDAPVEEDRPGDRDAAVRARAGAREERLGLPLLLGVERLLCGRSGPDDPGHAQTPMSRCISAWSSATVQRPSLSTESVIVQGWKRRTLPPWTKKTFPEAGQPSVAR